MTGKLRIKAEFYRAVTPLSLRIGYWVGLKIWRTAVGAEIDLVLDRGDERVAVEVKAGRGVARAGFAAVVQGVP